MNELENRIHERLQTCGYEPFLLKGISRYVTTAISLAIAEMYDGFPQGESPQWDDPEGELVYWSSINLDSQNRATGTWIKRRIETLEWLKKWAGQNRVKRLRRNYIEYYRGYEIYADREGGLNAELQSEPCFFVKVATTESLAKMKMKIDVQVKRMSKR